jgi:hypothetical protein
VYTVSSYFPDQTHLAANDISLFPNQRSSETSNEQRRFYSGSKGSETGIVVICG